VASNSLITKSDKFIGLATKFLSAVRSDGRCVSDGDIPRLIETLRIISDIKPPPERICDIGTWGAIEPALEQMFDFKDIVTTGYPGPDDDELVFKSLCATKVHRYRHLRFDIEETFPLGDSEFDLVIFTEVLEHISRDPMHTMGELNRITRSGGWLVLSTPNCASLTTVFRALKGAHPYHWSPYSREGDRDRHNREYTQVELHSLLVASGYRVQSLNCPAALGRPRSWKRAVFGTALNLTRRLMLGMPKSDGDGDMIFALARKVGPVQNRYPDFLYYTTTPIR
jgi:SAM-dependent methyltransferase